MMQASKNPAYEEIDLGAFNDEYAGQKVRVLVNPTRAFRTAYRAACMNAIFGVDDKVFTECLAPVLDMTPEEAGAMMNDLPPDAAQWLFFVTLDGFDGEKWQTVISPHLFRVWDDWTIKRVKAHAALPRASALQSADSTAAN